MMRCSGVGAAGTALALGFVACLGEDGRFALESTTGSGGATTSGTADVTSASSASTTATAASTSGAGGAPSSFSLLKATRFAAPLEQAGRALAVSGAAIYVAGELNGSIMVGGNRVSSHGGADALLFATDDNLDGIFGKAYGDDVAQSAYVAAFSPMFGDVLIAGSFSGKIPELENGSTQDEDFFTARVHDNGDREYHRYHEDAQTNAGAATNGGWVLAGDYDGYIDWAGDAGGKRDAFVAWTYADFAWADAVKIASDEDDTALGVAHSPSGQTAVVGEIKAAATCAGFDLAFGGRTDAFVAYFDEAHEAVFARGLGDGEDQRAVDVAFDPSGNLVVLGNFKGSIALDCTTLTSAGGFDFFVAILSPSGSCVTAKAFGGAKDQIASALAVTSSGNIVVTGAYLGAPSFGGATFTEHTKSDIFLLMLDADLSHVASAAFGAEGTQRGVDVAVDASDRIYLLADVQDDIDFGSGSLPPVDTTFDIALAQFAP